MDNRQYTGCTVNFKRTTVSYKVHKEVRRPEDEWQIIPDTQDPIIDENTWLRVQDLRSNKRRPTATGRTSLFSGLVYCPDCGAKLHFCAAKSLKRNKELEQVITDCEAKLKEAEKATVDLRMLLQGLREFTTTHELTPTIVNTVIRRIEVHNSDRSSGHCRVKVDIYFTAVGMIDLPTEQEIQKIIADIPATQHTA